MFCGDVFTVDMCLDDRWFSRDFRDTVWLNSLSNTKMLLGMQVSQADAGRLDKELVVLLKEQLSTAFPGLLSLCSMQ